MQRSSNIFDFLRALFAAFVLVTHSYGLSGTQGHDWLHNLTKGQTMLSSIGVQGFFIISGFFIYKSLLRSKSIWQYLMKRVLRIYPAYIVVLLLTVFVIAPNYSNLIYSKFVKDPLTLSYLSYNINLFNPLQYGLPGVFTDLPYKNAVNGSIWTIPYEFLFYILIIPIAWVKEKYRLNLLLLSFGILFTIKLSDQIGSNQVMMGTSFLSYYLIDFGLYFLSGSIIASTNLHKINQKQLLLGAIVVIVASVYFLSFKYVQFIALPVIVMNLGYSKIPILEKFSRFGDTSYGMYLYGFLIQQVLISHFLLNVSQMIVFSIVGSFIAGWISWHVVEKRALSLKSKL